MGKCCNLPFYWFLQAQKSLELDVSIALWLCDNERRGTVRVLGSLLPQAQPLTSFSHISSLQPNEFRFEGWKSLNGAFYHPEQGCSLPFPPEPGSPAPCHPPFIASPADRPTVSGTFGFAAKLLQFVCYFSSGCIYESCVPKRPPPHRHPFSLCFVSCRVFHPDTPNRHETGGGEHLALAAEHRQEEKLLEIKSGFFPLRGTLLWDVTLGRPAAPGQGSGLPNTITVCKRLKAVSFELATCFKLLCG